MGLRPINESVVFELEDAPEPGDTIEMVTQHGVVAKNNVQF